MKQKLHIWGHPVSAMTIGLFGVLFDARIAAAQPKDYTVELDPPDGLIACNDPQFFKNQYAFARGKQRFATPTMIDIGIRTDGPDGFDLNVAFKSAAQGTPSSPRNRKYPSTVECSRIVSDAAEIAAEMMRPDTQPLTIPTTSDHRFIIEAPPELRVCNDVEFLEKWFERARGTSRFQEGWPKTIHVKLRGTLNERVWADVVLRSPSGRIVHDVNGRPIDDIAYDFDGPTECAKVMSYVAQKLPMAFWPPPEPKPNIPPIVVPNGPPKLASLGSGGIYQRDLVPDADGMGMQLTYSYQLFQHVRLRADVRVFSRLPIQTGAERLSQFRLDYLATGSLAACAGWKVFNACALGAAGAAKVEAINFSRPKSPTLPIFHGGVLISAETPPIFDFFVRFESGFYINAQRGYKLTPPAGPEIKYVKGSPSGLTWSIIGGVRF